MIPVFSHTNIALFTENNYYLSIVIFIAFLSLSLITSKIAIQIAKSIGLIDIPLRESHKIHRTATPIAGGLAIILTVLPLVSFIHVTGLYQFDYYLFASFFLIFMVGMLDDLTNLSAKTKLIGQIAVSLLLVWGDHHAIVFDSYFLNIAISVVWYVGIMNAFNFIDSADGLLVGIGIIITASVFLATLYFSQTDLNLVSIGIMGLLIGLYLKNKKPAKLYLGDSGSLMLGLLFALVALKFNPIGFDHTTSWITPVLMMSFPIFDTSLVVFCRWRNNKPVHRAALDHTFHRLRRYCKKEKKPFLIIYGITILSSIISIGNLFMLPVLSFTFFGIVIVCGILLLILIEKTLPPEKFR